MKTSRRFLSLAMLILATRVHAQNGRVTDSATVVAVASGDTVVSPHAPVQSSIDAPPAAVQRNVSATPHAAFVFAETHKGLGQAKALMGVGIAGFVAGALIGGDSGKIIMVGGAVVGLYGLYLYLQ
jgi:hypothetical protein